MSTIRKNYREIYRETKTIKVVWPLNENGSHTASLEELQPKNYQDTDQEEDPEEDGQMEKRSRITAWSSLWPHVVPKGVSRIPLLTSLYKDQGSKNDNDTSKTVKIFLWKKNLGGIGGKLADDYKIGMLLISNCFLVIILLNMPFCCFVCLFFKS